MNELKEENETIYNESGKFLRCEILKGRDTFVSYFKKETQFNLKKQKNAYDNTFEINNESGVLYTLTRLSGLLRDLNI